MQETRHKDGSSGVKIKLHDKLAALDKLAKLLGYYRDDRLDRDNRPYNITHVEIRLGSSGRTETREVAPPPQHVIDGESRTLPEDEADSPS